MHLGLLQAFIDTANPDAVLCMHCCSPSCQVAPLALNGTEQPWYRAAYRAHADAAGSAPLAIRAPDFADVADWDDPSFHYLLEVLSIPHRDPQRLAMRLSHEAAGISGWALCAHVALGYTIEDALATRWRDTELWVLGRQPTTLQDALDGACRPAFGPGATLAALRRHRHMDVDDYSFQLPKRALSRPTQPVALYSNPVRALPRLEILDLAADLDGVVLPEAIEMMSPGIVHDVSVARNAVGQVVNRFADLGRPITTPGQQGLIGEGIRGHIVKQLRVYERNGNGALPAVSLLRAYARPAFWGDLAPAIQSYIDEPWLEPPEGSLDPFICNTCTPLLAI